MSEYILTEDLAVWFGKKKKKKGSSQPKGPWVNICKKKKGGGHPPCGRGDADKGAYPVCRGAGVAGKMSQKDKDSACRRKREKEKKDTQTGKGQKPTRIKVKNYKKKNESIDKLIKLVLEDKMADISISDQAVKSICDSEKFCKAQGPITFGQLRSIVDAAMNKRLFKNVGEGGVKAFLRLLPWFIPQVAIGEFIASAMRSANKVLGPLLKQTSSYKSWWAKSILRVLELAEGNINPTDPFSKIFFVSDGLMSLMNSKSKLKFAYYISELASEKPNDEPVPEFFVENELRSWINQRFLLDPPLEPKKLDSFDDVKLPLPEPEKEDEDLVDNTKLIESVLRSYTKEKTVISEELQYHIDNSLSLTENVFRYGSPKYFDVINEARKLYSEGYNQWSEEEVELLESDRGKFFNYKGKRLPFDFPMVNEQGFSWDGTYANESESEYKDDNVNYNVLLGYAIEMSKSLWSESNKDINLIGALKELKMYYLDLRNNKTPMSLSVPAEVAKNTVEKLVGELPNESLSSLEELGASLKTLSEAEYKGKDISLNKPKSGGPKKWYVYVKNPKTGKVIKVSYGSPVMTAKWNDPGARKSFAARHQCAKKKDKTKAGYWACRAHKDFGKNVSGRFW